MAQAECVEPHISGPVPSLLASILFSVLPLTPAFVKRNQCRCNREGLPVSRCYNTCQSSNVVHVWDASMSCPLLNIYPVECMMICIARLGLAGLILISFPSQGDEGDGDKMPVHPPHKRPPIVTTIRLSHPGTSPQPKHGSRTDFAAAMTRKLEIGCCNLQMPGTRDTFVQKWNIKNEWFS